MQKTNKSKWILETQGEEENIREYLTFDEAHSVMKQEYEVVYKRENRFITDSILEDNFADVCNEDFYQSWKIYKQKNFKNPIEKRLYEIKRELDRADMGVTEYVYKLNDSNVIREHLCKIEKLVNELEEMI